MKALYLPDDLVAAVLAGRKLILTIELGPGDDVQLGDQVEGRLAALEAFADDRTPCGEVQGEAQVRCTMLRGQAREQGGCYRAALCPFYRSSDPASIDRPE